MITNSQLLAMIKLLDDTDQEVLDVVERKFIELGSSIVPELEQIWLNQEFPELNPRIEIILKNIQRQDLFQSVHQWVESENPDVLTGWILASRVQYPGLKYDSVKAQLNQLKIDAWVMLSGVHNPLDQIAILNHIFFERNGYKGNNQNYHSPENSILPRVLETKMGNPISLAILYLTVAQDLGIPVFGINLPQHFVLAYCKLKTQPNEFGIIPKNKLILSDFESVEFYFNPFSKGQIFNKESIDAFLKVIKVIPQDNFYLPCSSMEIFKRILRNLHYSYGEQQDFNKQNEVVELMKLVGLQIHDDDFPEE